MLPIAVLLAAATSLSPTLRAGLPDAAPVARYTPEARAAAARSALHLAEPPVTGDPVSLTPDQTYADGVALNIWKPSFVLGTEAGGEAGFNFWGQANDGHVNLAFTSRRAEARLLDCRFWAPGPVTYKIYYGDASTPVAEGPAALTDHHLLLVIPAAAAGRRVLVEMWPAPGAVTAFFGCDLSAIG